MTAIALDLKKSPLHMGTSIVVATAAADPETGIVTIDEIDAIVIDAVYEDGEQIVEYMGRCASTGAEAFGRAYADKVVEDVEHTPLVIGSRVAVAMNYGHNPVINAYEAGMEQGIITAMDAESITVLVDGEKDPISVPHGCAHWLY